jgi:hypothetical protein
VIAGHVAFNVISELYWCTDKGESAVSAAYVPFFHVGILVRDIEIAARDFSAILGLEFEPVRTAPVVTGEMMRFRYSRQGPPYLELVEMAGSGIWAPDQGEGLHGIRVEYLESAMVAATFERLRGVTGDR